MTSLRSNAVEKIPWHGVLTSVRPRIRLGRSFDQRSHTYLGYALRVRGNMGSEAREFLVGVGESAQAKHQFQVGATVSGEALPVADPRLEIVEFYKVSNLKVAVRNPVEMIIDQWNPSKRRYRTETFCYGPRSCPLYRSGPARKAPAVME